MNFFRRFRNRKQASRSPIKRPGSRLRFARLCLERLEDRTLLSGLNFTDLAKQLTGIAQTMQGAVHNALAAADSIPFIGKQLQSVDELTAPIDAIASGLSPLSYTTQMQTEALIQSTLTTLLGPNHLSLLGNNVVQVSITPDGSSVTVEALLHKNVAAAPGISAFDLGLGKFLSVQSTAGFVVTVGFDYLLQFTYVNGQPLKLGDQNGHMANLSDLNPNLPATPLALDVSAALSSPTGPKFQIVATLNGLLQATATDLGGSHLTASVGLALNSSGGIGSVIVSGEAKADLHLKLEFAPGANLPINPQLKADFHIDWTFNPVNGNADGASSSFGDISVLRFDQVYFDVALSLPGFLTSIISDVQKFTMPFQPIVNLTKLELPILSSFGIHETIRDLLEQTGELPAGIGNALDAIDLINQLSVKGVGGPDIYLGSFDLAGNSRQNGFSSAADIIGGYVPAGLYAAADTATGGLLDKLQSQASFGLKFPILDDPEGSAFQLLLGQPVSLFTYTMPTLDLPLEATFGIDLGVIGLYLKGFIDTKIDLKVGYDTSGLQLVAKDIIGGTPGRTPGNIPGDILHGFYIDNTPTQETDNQGVGYTHYATGVNIQGGLLAAAAFIVKVEGGIFANVSLSFADGLDDPTDRSHGQYKVRLDSILDRLTNDPAQIFALKGEVYAQADLSLGLDTPFGDITLFRFTLATVVLVDFDTSQGTGDGELGNFNYPQMLPLLIGPGDNTITVESYTMIHGDSGGDADAIADSGIEVIYPDHKEYFPTTHEAPNLYGKEVTTVSATYFIVTDFGSSTAPAGNHTINIDPSIVDRTYLDAYHPYAPNATNWTGVNALLFGGPGDDHFEWHNPLGRATMVGGGGDDNLFDGNVEYAGYVPAGTSFGDTSKVDPAILKELMDSETGDGLGNTNLIGDDHTDNEQFHGGPGGNYFNLAGSGTDDSLYTYGGSDFNSPGPGVGDTLYGGSGSNWYEIPTSAQRVTIFGHGLGKLGSDTLHVIGGEDDMVLGGGPSSPTTVTVTGTSSALTITEKQAYGTLTVYASDITALDIEPRARGNATLTLPDLIPLDLEGITVDFGADSPAVRTTPATVPVHKVILQGSQYGEHFNVAGLDANEVLVSFEAQPSEVAIDEPVVIRGLTSDDDLVLDGAGSDFYKIALDPTMKFTTVIGPTGKGEENLIVDGSGFNPLYNYFASALAVTDTSVAFTNTYYGVLEESAFVTFDNHVSDLTVMAANGGGTISVNRRRGSTNTTVDGGTGNDVFQVNSLNGKLTLDGENGSDTYDINPNLVTPYSGSTSAAITISDSGTTGTNTLNFNDPGNAALNTMTQYGISSNTITRMAQDNALGTAGFATGNVAVTYSGVANVVLNSGFGVNLISVASTAAGVATTINEGGGLNEVYVTAAQQILSLLAGPLTIAGGGYNRVFLYDRPIGPYLPFAQITVTPTTVTRVGMVDYDGSVTSMVTETIHYSGVKAIYLFTPTAELTVDTLDPSQGNVYGVTGALQPAAAADYVGGYQVTSSLLPAVLFGNNLASLNVVESGGANSFDVYGTPSAVPTTLQMGLFGNVVVHGTSGPLTINGGPDTSNVFVGGAPATLLNPSPTGSLNYVHGAVTVNSGSGPLALDINYSSDIGPHHAQLTAGSLSAAAPALISFVGMSALTIHSDQWPGSDFTVAATPTVIKTVLDGGPGAHTFYVQSTQGPLDLNTGTGDSTVIVGDATHSMDALAGAVTIKGGKGTNHLTVDDRAHALYIIRPYSNQYTVTASQVLRPQSASLGIVGGVLGYIPYYVPVNYSNMATLVVDAGNVPTGNVIGIPGTPAGTAVTVNSGSGNDIFNIGDATNSLGGILGPLTVNGPQSAYSGGKTVVYVNDEGATAGAHYAVTSNTVTRPGAPTITYGFLSGLVLNTAGTSTTDVQSTFTGLFVKTLVTVNTGTGTSTVNVGTPGKMLDQIDTLTVNGGAGGATTLNLDDQANADRNSSSGLGQVAFTTRPAYSFTDDSVIRTDTEVTDLAGRVYPPIYLTSTIDFQNLAGLTLNGGTTPNVFNVQGTAAGTPVTINAGKSTDIVNVGDPNNTIDGLLGQLTVNGQKTTVLNVNDQGTTTDETYNLTSTTSLTTMTLTRSAFPPSDADGEMITFSAIASLVVHGGSGNNLFGVTGTPAGTAVTLYGGTANSDQFVVGDNSDLDSIHGSLTLHGQTAYSFAVFSDLVNAGAQTYTLAGNTLQRTGMADIAFDGLDQVVLYAGTGKDTVNVVNTLAATPVSIFTNGGNDTLNVSPVAHELGTIAGSVAFDALAGTDTLNLEDQASDTLAASYRITTSSVSRPGMAAVAFSNIPNVFIQTKAGKLAG